MDGQDFFHDLVFNDEAAFHIDIQAKCFFKREALVFNRHLNLVHGVVAAKRQFAHEAAFIDTFDQAGAFFAVNLNGSPDDLITEGISFVVFRMHLGLDLVWLFASSR